VERSGYSPFLRRPPWTDNPLAKRRRAAYGGAAVGAGPFAA
jgi:hypothetical protein